MTDGFSHLSPQGEVKMVDVSNKLKSLRTAEAEGRITLSAGTLKRIAGHDVAKGNVLATAKIAGIQAAKRCSDLIPLCHPLHLQWIDVKLDPAEDHISVRALVRADDATGVEMEALTAVSVACLTIYDMVKAVEKNAVIGDIRLVAKRGGRSDQKQQSWPRTAVIVLSDSIAAGTAEDRSGAVLTEGLKSMGCEHLSLSIIPDEADQLRQLVEKSIVDGARLIITSGGTGVSSRDQTVETLQPLFEKRLDGVSQLFHQFGIRNTRNAMLSRMTAGIMKNALVLCLPGSPAAAQDALDSLFPHILHAFPMMEGKRHGGEKS